jgi:UDP-2-acetamido-2,6-beta-L-arabino-hexul-4-ose reductase
MNILITGGEGFIAKNLSIKLRENGYENIYTVNRKTNADELKKKILSSDFIFHLAGENRPKSDNDFAKGNVKYTEKILNIASTSKKEIPIVFSSSSQATLDNPYGRSKLKAESRLISYSKAKKSRIKIFRLDNVFGKWSKPNYNSFISTFCYNVIRDLPIEVNVSSKKITLVYIDDVCDAFIAMLKTKKKDIFQTVKPTYKKKVTDVAKLIEKFNLNQKDFTIESVGRGFERKLYSTFLSYYPVERFSYSLKKNIDKRGVFAEVLKTHKNGQFSFFTAKPGITRGGHYHHTKNEKFLVLSGHALFKFENLETNEKYSIEIFPEQCRVVETIPGWTHDITNIGDSELIVMLWANEKFNPKKPDTISKPLEWQV